MQWPRQIIKEVGNWDTNLSWSYRCRINLYIHPALCKDIGKWDVTGEMKKRSLPSVQRESGKCQRSLFHTGWAFRHVGIAIGSISLALSSLSSLQHINALNSFHLVLQVGSSETKSNGHFALVPLLLASKTCSFKNPNLSGKSPICLTVGQTLLSWCICLALSALCPLLRHCHLPSVPFIFATQSHWSLLRSSISPNFFSISAVWILCIFYLDHFSILFRSLLHSAFCKTDIASSFILQISPITLKPFLPVLGEVASLPP